MQWAASYQLLRFCRFCRGARHVVELPAGAAARCGVEVGDRLRVQGAEGRV